MVNKPLIRPYFLGEVALGGVARIPLTIGFFVSYPVFQWPKPMDHEGRILKGPLPK